MNTAGIIAEYNPFHNGHKHHIDVTKSQGADAIVCVMSGYFVERGECSLLLPQKRAEMALKNGADLVVSLPLPWASAGAQVFARGAVSILNAMGCVDILSFGSECSDIEKLKSAALAIDDLAVVESLKENLISGKSFASARQEALSKIKPEIANVISNPNDTLAVEYIREIMLSNSKMKPMCVKREGAEHDSEESQNNIASASLIRNMIKENDEGHAFMPESAQDILKKEIEIGRAPADIKNLEKAILYHLRSITSEEIAKAPDISEGLENRIYDAARQAKSLEELYALSKVKRYSHARIRRAVINSFLGVTAQDSKGNPPYIRVLGFTQKGQQILRTMKKTATLPIIMRPADVNKLDERAKRIFLLEAHAGDIFSLATPEVQPCAVEYTQEIVRA